MQIKVRYSSIDHFRQTRRYTTLAGARLYAHRWIGAHPEMGTHYAISGDGVGKIEVTGCTLAELFPSDAAPAGNGDELTDEEMEIALYGRGPAVFLIYGPHAGERVRNDEVAPADDGYEMPF